MTTIHRGFVTDCFSSFDGFEQHVKAFKATDLLSRRREMKDIVADEAGTGMGGLSPTGGVALYGLVKEYRPQSVIETGVLNGWSTLVILTAMDELGFGRLYSIDLPARPGDDRQDTGARLPAGRDPGWCVSDDLAARWDLTLGRTQRQLPGVLETVGATELFVQDSEHTLPAMCYEYELGYEWLSPGGVLVTDDIGETEAFEAFVDVRSPDQWGHVTDTIGYIRKGDHD